MAVGCLAGVVSAAAASWHVLLAGWLVARLAFGGLVDLAGDSNLEWER